MILFGDAILVRVIQIILHHAGMMCLIIGILAKYFSDLLKIVTQRKCILMALRMYLDHGWQFEFQITIPTYTISHAITWLNAIRQVNCWLREADGFGGRQRVRIMRNAQGCVKW